MGGVSDLVFSALERSALLVDLVAVDAGLDFTLVADTTDTWLSDVESSALDFDSSF